MSAYKKALQIRWSDLDPNYHMRHSVYYDFAAQVRTEFLNEHGLSIHKLKEFHFGPILFREEAKFRREINFGDEITINLEVLKLRRDYSRYSIRHYFYKTDGTFCASLTIDGAWMDTETRKLTIPPLIGISMVDAMPKAKEFEWEEESGS